MRSVRLWNSARRLLKLQPEVRLPSGTFADDREFYVALDRFQQEAYRRLRFRYPEQGADPFCRLTALKTANAFAADYAFRNRHTRLVSRPVQLQVDPTNACHLHCPSCLHSAGEAWASRFDWPPATLQVAEFEEFCNQFGPCATGVILFRDGEPLLHRRFPEFVTAAKGYLLHTITSTSLSMRIDADALVASRLDRLVAAIDGATAATYNRYRRGGDFALVLDNLRALVRARKAQGSTKPWLVWQLLAFEHNVHEIEAAAELARRIGVDQLVVSKPHAVAHDDPSIRAAKTAPFGETLFSAPRDWCEPEERDGVCRNAGLIDSAFSQSWCDRYEAIGAGERGNGSCEAACGWLYYNLTMDAARRITPCCIPPMGPPEPRHLVYASFDGRNADDVINSSDAALARRRCRSEARVEAHSPYCLACQDYPSPPMWPDVSRYLRSVDTRLALPAPVHAALAASPLYQVSGPPPSSRHPLPGPCPK